MDGRQAASLGVSLKSKGHVLCQHLNLSIHSSFLASCHFQLYFRQKGHLLTFSQVTGTFVIPAALPSLSWEQAAPT